MFRKIVSNIAFSPALAQQLGFYAKRLRKEEVTRRMGLIFTALALVVQSFAVFSPPEAANASSASDFVRGGVTSKSEFLSYYDRNSRHIKDIFDSVGITRQEIVKAKNGTINSQEVFSWGLTSRFSAAQGERVHTYKKDSGGTANAYFRPLDLWDTLPYTIKNGSTYSAFIGHSAKFGWFAIMKNCGNLITKHAPVPPPKPTPPPSPKPAAACQDLSVDRITRTRYQLNAQSAASNGAKIKSYAFTVKDSDGQTVNKTVSSTQRTATYVYDQSTPGDYTATVAVNTSIGTKTDSDCAASFTVAKPQMCAFNQSLPISSPDCQPCPGNSLLWIKDEKCHANIVKTKAAINISQDNVDASTVTAKASDRIAYTITVSNTGLKSANTPIQEKLDDVLEYAALVDTGGGNLDRDTSTLTWSSITLEPGKKQSRTFVVKLADAIPAVGQGTSDKTSYNCIMTNTFGNTINTQVDCPAPKVVEQVITELPQTGPAENTLFAGVVIAVVAFFYARSRQVKKEIRLIRRDINAGTI